MSPRYDWGTVRDALALLLVLAGALAAAYALGVVIREAGPHPSAQEDE